MNDVEFNPEFVSRMIPKLEWSVLVQAAEEVSVTPPISFTIALVLFVFNLLCVMLQNVCLSFSLVNMQLNCSLISKQ